jgi:hypothetical protein
MVIGVFTNSMQQIPTIVLWVAGAILLIFLVFHLKQTLDYQDVLLKKQRHLSEVEHKVYDSIPTDPKEKLKWLEKHAK